MRAFSSLTTLDANGRKVCHAVRFFEPSPDFRLHLLFRHGSALLLLLLLRGDKLIKARVIVRRGLLCLLDLLP